MAACGLALLDEGQQGLVLVAPTTPLAVLPGEEDFERVEAELLATGYRFEMSAVVSLQEEPEKYKPVEGPAESGANETDADKQTRLELLAYVINHHLVSGN